MRHFAARSIVFVGLTTLGLFFVEPSQSAVRPPVAQVGPSAREMSAGGAVPSSPADRLPAPTRPRPADGDRIFDGPITMRDAMRMHGEIQSRRDARTGEKTELLRLTSREVFEEPLQRRVYGNRGVRCDYMYKARWERMGKPAFYDGYETEGLPERAGDPKPLSFSEAISGLETIQARRNARTARDSKKQWHCTLSVD